MELRGGLWIRFRVQAGEMERILKTAFSQAKSSTLSSRTKFNRIKVEDANTDPLAGEDDDHI